jgi:hypothetical protein
MPSTFRLALGVLLAWSTWAASLFGQSQSAEQLAQEKFEDMRKCRLPGDELPLPPGLTTAQQGYLPELCALTLLEHSRILLQAPEPSPSSSGAADEELRLLEQAIYSVRKENVLNMANLLRRALQGGQFDEEGFWNAWTEEKRRYAKAIAPLLIRQVELAESTAKQRQPER